MPPPPASPARRLQLLATALAAACAVASGGVSGAITQIAAGDDAGLRAALEDPSVTRIALQGDVQLQPHTWTDGARPQLRLARNVTITSAAPAARGFATLDFAFLGQGQLLVAPGCILTLAELILVNGRYGPGMQLDWVAPSPGAIVAFANTVVMRAACIESTSEPDAVAVQPRLQGYPGQQRAHYASGTVCVKGTCRNNTLVYDDFTKLSTVSADTAAGGYALILRNTTKFCLSAANACLAAPSTEECVQQVIDASPTTAPSPGQRGAAAAAAAAHRQRGVVGAAVGAALGGLLLAALLLFLLLLRPRWRQRQQADAALQKHMLAALPHDFGGSGAAGGAAGGAGSGAGLTSAAGTAGAGATRHGEHGPSSGGLLGPALLKRAPCSPTLSRDTAGGAAGGAYGGYDQQQRRAGGAGLTPTWAAAAAAAAAGAGVAAVSGGTRSMSPERGGSSNHFAQIRTDLRGHAPAAADAHGSGSHMLDTWQLVGWMSSSRFGGGQQQQQQQQQQPRHSPPPPQQQQRWGSPFAAAAGAPAAPAAAPAGASATDAGLGGSAVSSSSNSDSSSSAHARPRSAALSSQDGPLLLLQQQLHQASSGGSPFVGARLRSHALSGANKVALGVLLGAGAFGRVYRGRWRGMDVAVKVLQHSRAAAAAVSNEVNLMMSFSHPHVVSAHHFVTWQRKKRAQDQEEAEPLPAAPLAADAAAASSTPPDAAPVLELPSDQQQLQEQRSQNSSEDMQTWIVQEFCDAGSLAEYAIIHGDKQEGQLPTGHAMLRLLFRLREVADGMAYLHNAAHVVHGDLKASNILLVFNPTAPYARSAKVADFGLARVHAVGETHRSTRTLGTISHMAPELLRYGKASMAADVYSFGIMMWELLVGQPAFRGHQFGFIYEQVALLGERPPVPDGVPEDYTLLMEACWAPDPTQRPTFAQVLRCIEIMIASEQQQVAEAAAAAAAATATAAAAASITSSTVATDAGERGCVRSSSCDAASSAPLYASLRPGQGAAGASTTSASGTATATAGVSLSAAAAAAYGAVLGISDTTNSSSIGSFEIRRAGSFRAPPAQQQLLQQPAPGGASSITSSSSSAFASTSSAVGVLRAGSGERCSTPTTARTTRGGSSTTATAVALPSTSLSASGPGSSSAQAGPGSAAAVAAARRPAASGAVGAAAAAGAGTGSGRHAAGSFDMTWVGSRRTSRATSQHHSSSGSHAAAAAAVASRLGLAAAPGPAGPDASGAAAAGGSSPSTVVVVVPSSSSVALDSMNGTAPERKALMPKQLQPAPQPPVQQEEV